MLRLLFVLCILFLVSLFASPTLIVKSEFVDIKNYPSYFKGKLTPQEALKKYKNNEFTTLPKNIINSCFNHNSFWLAIELQNQDIKELFLSMTDISTEKVIFYESENDKLSKIKNDSSYFIPKILLQKIDSPKLYLIKIESSVPFIVQVLIGNKNDVLIYQLSEIVSFSIFIGILFSLFIYNIFLYFSTKENDYILYAIYIICLACWILSSHGYFSVYFQLNLILGNTLKTFFLVINLLFLVLFSLQFLNKKNFSNKLIMSLFISAMFLFFIIIKLETLDYCATFIVLILTILFLFYFGLLSLKNKYSSLKYYLIAIGGYLFTNVLVVLMFLGYLNTSFYILQSQLFGSAWLIIFLSLALGDKIRLLQIEKKEIIMKSQLQEKLLFLQSQQASLGELLGNITHQWREPLGEIGAIQTNLHGTLLIKGTLSKEKVLNSIEQSSKIIKHLSNTINVFYSLFKQTKIKNEKFDLVEEIKNIQTLIFYTLKTENIRLDLDNNLDETFIYGDKNEFINAVLNIVLNAKDILVERKILNPWIKIKTIKTNKKVSITIEDNAGGISFEPIEKIFDSCITSKENSIGIGLFISYKIITQRMDGKISVQNTNNGALFTIRLPLSINCEHNLKEITNEDKIEELILDRIIRLEKEVERKNETEKALNQWEEIFYQTNWGVSLHQGMSDRFKMVNPAFCSMHGYSLKEVMEKYIIDFVAKESLDFVKEKVKEAMEKSFVSFESIHKRKDGSKFPVNVDLTVIKDERGDILYHIANIRDISEQKESQQKLLLKTFTLGHIQENVFLIDKNAKFHYVNESTCNALGYTKEELLSLGVTNINPNISFQIWQEHWEDIKKQKSTLIISSHRRKDGTLFPIEVSSNYFEYNGLAYSLAISRDITERLEAEKRKEDEKMRLFFERQLVGMAITLPSKKWLNVNEKLCQMLGYSSKELTNMTWDEVTYPEDLEGDINLFEQLLKGEIEYYFYEKRYVHKNGNIIFTNLSIGCVRKDDNSVDYLIVLIEDITERKKIEKVLTKKEQELRLLADSSPGMMGTFYLRPDGSTCMPYVSPNILDIYGLEQKDVREDATAILSLTHPDDADLVRESIDESARTMNVWHEEYRILHPIKGERWMESNTMPQFHSDGGIIWYGYIHDITERKQMEEALKTSEQEFRTLIENATDNIARYDKEARVTYMNPQLEKTLGVSYESILGEKPSEHRTDGLYIQYEIELKKVIATGENAHTYLTLPDTENGEQYHYIQIVAERDVYDNIIGAIAFGRDVTELTNKTIELQKSLEFNEGIIAAIPDLLLEVAPDGTYVGVWAQNPKILAAQKEMLLGNDFKKILPPDVVSIGLQTFKEVDEKGFSLGNTYSLDLPEGKRWFELSASKKKLSGNYIILARDITERKQMEKEIKDSYDFLNYLIDSIPDPIFVKDKMHKWIHLNKAFSQLVGFEKEKLLGKSDYDIFPKEEADIFWQKDNNVFDSKQININEELITSIDGVTHCIETVKDIFENDGKEYLVGTIRDITERKIAEEKIKELNLNLEQKVIERTEELTKSEETFKAMVENSPDVIIRYDKEGRRIYINPLGLVLMGKAKEELLGKTPRDFSPFYDVKEFEEAFSKVLREVSEVKFEAPFRIPSGEKRWGETRIVPELDKQGDIVSVLVVGRDITELKKAERELKRREEKCVLSHS